MTVTESIKQKLDEAAYIIRLQTARIEELTAENERLRSAAGAHGVLKAIYGNPDQPTGHRIKAAGLALPHETPKLMPERAPLELKAAEPERSLGELCEARMARQLALEGRGVQYRGSR